MTLRARFGLESPGAERYGWTQLLGDCSGGVIAALIALPYGLAMASLMGLPPVLGVFTSILTAPVIALFGRNPVLIGGTASATVPFLALAARQHGVAGAAQLSILASFFMMLFAVTRLGRHMAKVPHAVVTGFSCGIGGMMLVSQLDIMLGLATPMGRSAATAVGQLASVLDRIGEARMVPLVLGLAVILVATVAARISPHAPAPLVGVILAFAIARFFGFREKEVGVLPAMLPPVVNLGWKLQDMLAMLPSAAALAFVSSVNILITSRVVEHFRGRHKRMKASDADFELGAYGVANCVAGAFRRAAQRGHSGAQPGGGALRRHNGSGESSACGGAAGDSVAGVRRSVAHSDSGAGGRHGVDGVVPPGLERVAEIAQDDARGCGRLPGNRGGRDGLQRSAGGGGGLRNLRRADGVAALGSPGKPSGDGIDGNLPRAINRAHPPGEFVD